MKWMAGVLLLMAPVVSMAQTVDDLCPTLPSSSLRWNTRLGTDYRICYLPLPNASGAGLGVYYGHHPSFKERRKFRAEKGAVGTVPVVWHRKETVNDARPFSREAWVRMPGADKNARNYVWIDAATAADLSAAQRVAGEIRFK